MTYHLVKSATRERGCGCSRRGRGRKKATMKEHGGPSPEIGEQHN